mgnify:CR=1 FL=1
MPNSPRSLLKLVGAMSPEEKDSSTKLDNHSSSSKSSHWKNGQDTTMWEIPQYIECPKKWSWHGMMSSYLPKTCQICGEHDLAITLFFRHSIVVWMVHKDTWWRIWCTCWIHSHGHVIWCRAPYWLFLSDECANSTWLGTHSRILPIGLGFANVHMAHDMTTISNVQDGHDLEWQLHVHMTWHDMALLLNVQTETPCHPYQACMISHPKECTWSYIHIECGKWAWNWICKGT